MSQRGKNNSLTTQQKEELTTYKQQRGHYFIVYAKGKTHNNYFHEYENYCNAYKRIALKRGQVIAKIKGIKREQIESQNLKYWSLIFQDKDGAHLWMIPKNKMKDVKVTASVPPYVLWDNTISPVTENIVHSDIENTITWFVGDLDAGVGIGDKQVRRVAFSLSFVPSASQLG